MCVLQLRLAGLTRDCSRPLHSGGATLLSPGGTIALRTSSSSSHGRKGRERERGSEGEGVRERKERVVEAPRQHRRGISPSVPTLIALPRLLSSPAGLLACWPRIVMASFSQRRSGGAGPPFKAAAGDCLRLVQYNTRYLRPPHTVLTGACRYTTRGRVAPPAPLALYCRGQLARRDTSTRSSRHSILIPGPVWIYYRLGTLGMCGRAIMVSCGWPS